MIGACADAHSDIRENRDIISFRIVGRYKIRDARAVRPYKVAGLNYQLRAELIASAVDGLNLAVLIISKLAYFQAAEP